MSSAICFNLDRSKNLSSGNGLIRRFQQNFYEVIAASASMGDFLPSLTFYRAIISFNDSGKGAL